MFFRHLQSGGSGPSQRRKTANSFCIFPPLVGLKLALLLGVKPRPCAVLGAQFAAVFAGVWLMSAKQRPLSDSVTDVSDKCLQILSSSESEDTDSIAPKSPVLTYIQPVYALWRDQFEAVLIKCQGRDTMYADKAGHFMLGVALVASSLGGGLAVGGSMRMALGGMIRRMRGVKTVQAVKS